MTLKELIERAKSEANIVIAKRNMAGAEVNSLAAKHRLSEQDERRLDDLRDQMAKDDEQIRVLTEKVVQLEAEDDEDRRVSELQKWTTDVRSGHVSYNGAPSDRASMDRAVRDLRAPGFRTHEFPPAPDAGARYDDGGLTYEARGDGTPVRQLGGGPRDHGVFIRTVDRLPAVVERHQRIADHPIASEVIARAAARDQAIVGQHGDLGQLVRAMSTTSGAAIVPTVWAADVIDRARNLSAVMQAGARLVPMEAKTVQIGRLTGDPTAAFRAEGSAISASDVTLDNVTLTATTMNALVVSSVEWFQDAPNSEALVQEAIAQAMATQLDLVCLYGSITSGAGSINLPTPNNPRGILGALNAVASTSVLGGATNGTTQTSATFWNEILDLIYTPRDYNEAPNALIWNSKAARLYAKAYDTTGQPLQVPAEVQAMQRFVSNQIPSYTQGTMTNAATDVFCGDFSQLLVGQRLDLTLQVLNEAYATNGQIGFLATWRGDVGLARPRAFSVHKALKGA